MECDVGLRSKHVRVPPTRECLVRPCICLGAFKTVSNTGHTRLICMRLASLYDPSSASLPLDLRQALH